MKFFWKYHKWIQLQGSSWNRDLIHAQCGRNFQQRYNLSLNLSNFNVKISRIYIDQWIEPLMWFSSPWVTPAFYSHILYILIQTLSSEVSGQYLCMKNYPGWRLDNNLPPLPSSNTHFRPSMCAVSTHWIGWIKPLFHPLLTGFMLVLWVARSSWESSLCPERLPVLWHKQSTHWGIKLLSYFEDQQLLFLKYPHCSMLELVHLNPLIDGC